MRFAKIVFIAAGVWGIVVVTPLYFLLDVTGRQYAPPTAYPQFFYGFLSVTMAWQIAFLVIGSNPEGGLKNRHTAAHRSPISITAGRCSRHVIVASACERRR